MLLSLAAPSVADEPPENGAPPVRAVDPWQFRVAVPLYGWLPNLEGTAQVEDTSIDFDLSHGDVLDLFSTDLSGFWSFYGDVRRDRVTFSLDVYYVSFDQVSLSEVNLDPSNPRVKVDADQEYTFGIFHPALAYTLVDEPLDLGPFERFTFEPLVALRYVYFDAEAKLDDALLPSLQGREVLDDTEHYFELLPLGGRFDLAFLDKWSLRGRFMLGGWGLWDSDHGTDGMADLLLAYRFHPSWTLEAGVRWYDMNVVGNELDYELRNVWGPIVGVIWSF